MDWIHRPWTVERFVQAVRAKKPRAAKGPDEITQLDLRALPDSAVKTLVRLFEAVETRVPWPAQLASGFVNSLAKQDTAQCVDEFRLVVVYSLGYRIWSCVRAREALQSVASLLPSSVQGGVPCRQAKAIWFDLAHALEQAYLNGTGLHGLLMDIQKCFNNIPRYPLWFVLNRMGFPLATLRAWVSFVASQTRRFRVRHSAGEPLTSTCGLPEGCALSVSFWDGHCRLDVGLVASKLECLGGSQDLR